MKYVQACIDKGDLGSWRVRIGEELRRHCRLCYEVLETGVHLAFGCAGGEQLGRVWSPWEEMDEKHRWVRSTPTEGGVSVVVGLVQEYFGALDRALGVG